MLNVVFMLHLKYPLLSASVQLRYGEPTLRRAVPLALALISVSNPRLNILDTLSKFSHDADPEVSHNSIFAMGMVGSGEWNVCARMTLYCNMFRYTVFQLYNVQRQVIS